MCLVCLRKLFSIAFLCCGNAHQWVWKSVLQREWKLHVLKTESSLFFTVQEQKDVCTSASLPVEGSLFASWVRMVQLHKIKHSFAEWFPLAQNCCHGAELQVGVCCENRQILLLPLRTIWWRTVCGLGACAAPTTTTSPPQKEWVS